MTNYNNTNSYSIANNANSYSTNSTIVANEEFWLEQAKLQAALIIIKNSD